MEESAALITAIAALIAAIAWPAIILLIVYLFKEKISAAFERLPSILDRMNKLKLGVLEAELEKQAQSVAPDLQGSEEISPQQIQAAAKVESQARSLDQQSLKDKIQQLCFEYETIRKVLPSGAERSRAMTQTFVKMRTLGPAVADWIEEMKASTVAGNRLMAIAIMQINPDRADFNWLVDRFRSEHPFVFFHAAQVLRIIAQSSDSAVAHKAREAAGRAREIIDQFKGVKDRGTLTTLDSILHHTNPRSEATSA